MNTASSTLLVRLSLCLAVAIIPFSRPAAAAEPRSAPLPATAGRVATGGPARPLPAAPAGDVRATLEGWLARQTASPDLYRRAMALAVADDEALLRLPGIWERRPVFQPRSLADAPFPAATAEEIGGALGALVLSYLNQPGDLSEAEARRVDAAMERAVTALSLHLQVIRAGLSQGAPDSPPRRAGNRPRAAGRARSYSPRANGGARNARARPGAALPPAASPAGRSSRVFGSLRITADQFTDAPGGQVLATGGVQIGTTGRDGDYQLGGAHDAVTLTGTSLIGYGSLMLIAGNLALFTGRFTADGSAPQPLIVPVAPVYTLSALGDFPIQDSLAITGINLATAQAAGWARLHVALPGIDLAVGADFRLSPGPLISGALEAFVLHLAGASLTIDGASLSNQAITAQGVTLALPAWLGGASITAPEVSITRQGLRFGGGVSLALPDIRFGDGSHLSIVNIQATLVETRSLYVFTASGDISLTLSGRRLTPIPVQFLVDSHGYLSGSLDRLVLPLAGCTLAIDHLVLDTTGLGADAAILTLPQRFGGESIGVQDVSITRGGLSIGCGVLRVPDIRFGPGDRLKIVDILFAFTESDGFYQFEASGRLVVNLPQNALSPIAVRFIVDSNGNLSGTVSPFTVRVADATLSTGAISLDDDGLAIVSSTLALGTRFGAVSVGVQDARILSDGLHIDTAGIRWPDIPFGSGNTARLADIGAIIAQTAQGYLFQGNATLVIDLPQNGQSIRAQFTVDPKGDLSGAVDRFRLVLAGCSLAVDGVTLSNAGLAAGSAQLTLPPWAGGASVGVTGITLTDQGLRIDGGVTLRLPDIAFGDAVAITDITATLQTAAGVYTFEADGVLRVNLPRNRPPPIPISFDLDSQGTISGRVQQLSLTLAGCGLSIQDLALGNTGLALGDGRLAMPSHLGGGFIDIRDVAITGDGLALNGGVAVSLPDLALGSGRVMWIVGVSALLTQSRAPTDTVYVFSASGTLSLTLPGNALAIPIRFTLDTNGDVSATVDRLQARFAGCVLTMDDAALGNDGLWVEAASLKLPPVLRGLTATVRQVSISAEDGLALGMAVDLPDIRIGGVVNFVGMQAFLKLAAGPVLTLGISGTLALRIPFNTQDIHFLAQIDDTGRFSGSIDRVSLTVSRGLLDLRQVGFDNTGLSVSAGTLIISLTRRSPIHIQVRDVKIDGTAPYIHFEGGRRAGATAYPLPDTRVGDGDGFPLTGGELVLEPGADQAYHMTVAGVLSVPVGSQAASTPVTLTLGSAGQMAGRAGGFAVPLAGLTLLAGGADFAGDRLILDDGRLLAPAGWGGGQARVYDAVISPDEVLIGNGWFALPDLQAGPFTLTRLQGRLVSRADDYAIAAAGRLRIPGFADSPDCGIQVSATLSATPSAAQPAGLAVDGLSYDQDDCAIPVGRTGVAVTGASGQLTLPENASHLELHLGVAGGLSMDGAAAMRGDGLTATVSLPPFRMDVEGRLGVYSLFAPSLVAGSLGEAFVAPSLQVDMPAMRGGIALSLWQTGADFEFVGSGRLQLAVARGAMWHSCAGAICIDLPPSDQAYTAAGELGDLPNGSWGWQTWLPLALSGTVRIGASLDHTGAFRARSLERYQRVSPGAATAVAGAAPISVSVPVTADVIFALARPGAAPTLTLVSPGGAVYTQDALPGNMIYQEDVLTRAVASLSGSLGVVTYTQGLVIGSRVEPGVWQVRLNGAAGQSYLVDVIGADPAPQLSGVAAAVAPGRRARIDWTLVSNNPDTGVSIRALPASITPTAGAFLGFAITRSVASALDGAPSSAEVDLSGLPGGAYAVWVEAHDRRNPPVRVYAAQPITVPAEWQAAWAGNLSAEAGYRQLALHWQPMDNPDADRYRLLIQSEDGAARAVDAGQASSITLYNLSPGQPYTLTLEAVSEALCQFARAETIVARPLGAPFEIEVGSAPLALNGGVPATVVLTVSTPLEAYPEPVVLAMDQALDGVEVQFDARAVTPTRQGVAVRAGVLAADSLPGGVYTASLAASGPGERRGVALQLAVRQPAFDVQATPAAVVLGEGEIRAAVIGITGQYGAARPVALGADPAADGLAYRIDPITAAPGYSATLTLSDTPHLRPGAYLLRLAGDDGLRERVVSVTVQVDKSGFSLAAAPGVLVGRAGSTVSAAIDVAAEGWTQPVRVQVDDGSYPAPGARIGLAAGPGAALADAITVTPPARVFLVAALTAAARPGAYRLGVTGGSLGRQATAGVLLVVAAGKQAHFLPVVTMPATSGRTWYLPLVVRSWTGGLHEDRSTVVRPD